MNDRFVVYSVSDSEMVRFSWRSTLGGLQSHATAKSRSVSSKLVNAKGFGAMDINRYRHIILSKRKLGISNICPSTTGVKERTFVNWNRLDMLDTFFSIFSFSFAFSLARTFKLLTRVLEFKVIRLEKIRLLCERLEFCCQKMYTRFYAIHCYLSSDKRSGLERWLRTE